MKRALIIACVLAIATVPLLQAQPAPDAVPVFITSAGAMNGFTDPNKDNRDSVNDLWDAMKGYKSMKRAEDRDRAKIVIIVEGRETAQTTAGFLGPARDRVLHTKFIVKDFETEMSASAQGGTMGSGGAWGHAAGKIMRQVNEWVLANRHKL